MSLLSSLTGELWWWDGMFIRLLSQGYTPNPVVLSSGFPWQTQLRWVETGRQHRWAGSTGGHAARNRLCWSKQRQNSKKKNFSARDCKEEREREQTGLSWNKSIDLHETWALINKCKQKIYQRKQTMVHDASAATDPLRERNPSNQPNCNVSAYCPHPANTSSVYEKSPLFEPWL